MPALLSSVGDALLNIDVDCHRAAEVPMAEENSRVVEPTALASMKYAEPSCKEIVVLFGLPTVFLPFTTAVPCRFLW